MDTNNRIGSACWYKPDNGPTCKWRPGILRAWSTDSEVHHVNEVEPFPVGVIEDSKTNVMKSVYVGTMRICFAAEPPGGQSAIDWS